MKSMLFSSAAVLVLMSAGCQSVSDVATPSAPSIAPAQAAAPAAPTPAEASAYLRDAEAKLKAFREYASKIAWVQATNITDDTNWLMARASAEGTELSVQLANGTKRFQGVPLSPSDTRKMQRLLSGITLPAPSTPGAAEELAQITTRLSSTYST
jgi:peptidyl-dipeptidase A